MGFMKEDYKEDLRIIRTRKLLTKALFDLLENMPFEKISVMDICEKAMVHRATFYNHFESKEHLLEFALEELKEELFASTVEKENYPSVKEMSMSLIGKVIDFVDENRDKILLILRHNSFENATEIFVSTTKRSISYLLSKNEYKEEYLIPKDILIDFFIGGITNIGLNWLLSPNPCSKEELYHYFDILLNEKMYVKEKGER